MNGIRYHGSVHGEDEIEAVNAVLRGGPEAMRLGANVEEFEKLVAGSFGKQRGVMCNSGSSALELAVELLNLDEGSEVVTPPVTFSTDVAPLVRRGLVPVYVDIELDTFQIDIGQIEGAIGPKTKAMLIPNLIGNCPDWDQIRSIADRHDLLVIEDSCDCLGATLRGRPTGTRSDISVTSFALSHIITAAGTGGMVVLDDPTWVDRCLTLRRWGRRSEPRLFGSARGTTRIFSDVDGIEYDDIFIFDEVGWNFEPNEISASFGLVQFLKLAQNLERRRRNFELLSAHFGQRADVFLVPTQDADLITGWQAFPFTIKPDSGIKRSDFQRHMEAANIDTRMVWTGNVTRHPAFRDKPYRVADGGLPNADVVFASSLIVPCNHGIDDDGISYMCDTIDKFFANG